MGEGTVQSLWRPKDGKERSWTKATNMSGVGKMVGVLGSSTTRDARERVKHMSSEAGRHYLQTRPDQTLPCPAMSCPLPQLLIRQSHPDPPRPAGSPSSGVGGARMTIQYTIHNTQQGKVTRLV